MRKRTISNLHYTAYRLGADRF